MKSYCGNGKTVTYFEGWYFKHQKKKHTLCFIPGIQIDEWGSASAFIQVISNDKSHFIKYPYHYFRAHPKGLYIKIGDNLFTKKGIKVNIHSADLQIKGRIRYGEFSPIQYDIMGPLRFLPLMKCKHGIISMSHSLHGKLQINGKTQYFDKGQGYIEKDLGSSFPSYYFWTQCNDFKMEACSIVTAVADINIICKEVRGCFAVIQYEGKEYRLATYLGARVAACCRNMVCIKQGKYTLYITTAKRAPQGLQAPENGKMSRTIYEDASCYARYRFYISGEKLFDLTSNYASVEYMRR